MARRSRAGVAATCQLNLRLTPAEKATMVTLAKARGVEPADLVRAWLALAAGGVLVPASAPMPGRSADPSLEGAVRWLVELLEQVSPAKVRALPGGAAILTAVTDLRARQVEEAAALAPSSPPTSWGKTAHRGPWERIADLGYMCMRCGAVLRDGVEVVGRAPILGAAATPAAAAE